MNINHNRIKVADLETNQPNKILTTNLTGELEFSNLNSIKIDSHNGLDYTQEGKALDARQGKILNDAKINKALGVLNANKLLGTDENGNLKMFAFPTSVYPAPHLEEIFPLSVLPNTTGNITLKGSFFTPDMTVSITGQNINYITFINDNLIKVNITTGSIEGLYAITLNNGVSATFINALSIVLGTPYYPVTSDWSILSGPVITDNNEVLTSVFNSEGVVKLLYELKKTENFSFRFRIKPTPTGNSNEYKYFMYFYDVLTLEEKYAFEIAHGSGQFNVRTPSFSNHFIGYDKTTWRNYIFELRYIEKKMYFYINGNLTRTFPASTLTNNLYLTIKVGQLDVFDIKYITLV